MTAINLPGQLEVPLVVDHKKVIVVTGECKTGVVMADSFYESQRDVQIAKLLQKYEERPTSETWSRIQALAKEILK